MAVGELFLSAFLQVLFDRLASPELLNFARREGLRKKLNKWEKLLKTIKAVLDDAEERQYTDEAVKDWLDDLRDLAYDVEDILGEFDTEALRNKSMRENQASTSKVRNLIPACCTQLNPSSIKINIRLGSKIEDITTRFNDIVTRKDQLSLKGNVNGSSGSDRRRPRRDDSTSLVKEAGVCGREGDLEAILKSLLSKELIPANLSVIPIRGMGGIGKTTLAQLVYNDKRVESFFDIKAWACVSEDFDIAWVTKIILESDTSEKYDGKDLNWLQEHLKKKLQGKKFLVILDDVWTENYNEWIFLLAPFQVGAPGSAIVVTTRNEKVSSMVGTMKAYPLSLLSDDDCLPIFTLHALGTRDFSAHPNLKEAGEEIVRKCKGLPLAAKTLGGLLRTTQNLDEWEEVLKSKIWEIPEEKSEIVPALMLSYHHLPSHLKRCFAYCSIFPKDYEFEEKELVLLWMAEGLIQSGKQEKQMEDLGGKYFRDLLSRSFFQKSSEDNALYLMHDIINDLAQLVAGDTCFRMEDRIKGNKERSFLTKARHSSYLGGRYDSCKKFELFSELTSLRTFLPFNLPNLGRCYLSCIVPLQLLPKLQGLRVLSLRGYCVTEISDSVGDLKHLRYFDLSYTAITSMPESITNLYNLQTLLLENCRKLVKLPSMFAYLVNLRHLNVVGADSLEGMPPQIGKLACLQTLPHLVVGKGNYSRIKELGSLSNLQGTLCISRLENVIESEDATDATLIGKSNLDALLLEWSGNLGESQDKTKAFEVLDKLRPHSNLKELTIRHYGGEKFPTWFRGASFPNMVILRIENCTECTILPPIGELPSLQVLSIEGLDKVKNIGVEFLGEGCSQPFKSLRTLHFENMPEWENWSPGQEFRGLVDLSIESCPKLSGELPNQLPLLKKVVIEKCAQLVVSISRFPELCEVAIKECKGLVCRNDVGFRSLRSLEIRDISESASHIEGLTHVEDLSIDNCQELMPLWSNNVGLLQHLPRLRNLTVDTCSELVSLVAKEVGEQPQLGLPSALREIVIESCYALESLPKAVMYNTTCLESIELWRCDSLTYIAKGHLPPTLRRLKIQSCKNIRTVLLEEDIQSCTTSLLEELDIGYCAALESLTSSGELPATLKHLSIWGCETLESIAESFPQNSFLEFICIWDCGNLKSLPRGIHGLSNLHKLVIKFCPNLDPFPDGERELLPPKLRELIIEEAWEKMVHGIHNLASLQELRIWRCPGIVSFPEEGFPTNIIELDIRDSHITEALFEWGLHRLTSLRRLQIEGGCPHLVSFPTPKMMLPASLTSLHISRFPNLESLSSDGFRRLLSLEHLVVAECEKLTNFPKNDLPPSLLILQISKCPLLEERYKRDQGREWSKIAHIPCVEIDDRLTYRCL